MKTLSTPTSRMFGLLPHVNPSEPMQSLARLSKKYGGLIEMRVLRNRRVVIVSDPVVIGELSNPQRFEKLLTRPLLSLRGLAGDGLFTARGDEPNWTLAHSVLAPSFSRRAVRDYHPAMLDVALQLTRRWCSRNPGETVDVTADMTRLTLETIGLCGFGYRFHNFERDQPHPFVKAMNEALEESLASSFRLPWELNPLRSRRHQQNLQYLNQTVDDVLAARRKSGERHPDLLDRMLWTADPDSGAKLTDENIRYQILTFLVAGHETTSGLLSFAIHALVNHPEVRTLAIKEASSISTRPTFEETQSCRFLKAVLQETLRLWPTAPVYGLKAKQNTKLKDCLEVGPKDEILVVLPSLHSNSEYWKTPHQFDPARFLERCPHRHQAYRPFGQGKRSCIGQSFALHEALLCLVTLLQSVELGGTTGPLQVQESLTLKPRNFTLQVRPRICMVA